VDADSATGGSDRLHGVSRARSVVAMAGCTLGETTTTSTTTTTTAAAAATTMTRARVTGSSGTGVTTVTATAAAAASAEQRPWQQRLLGKQLVRYGPEEDGGPRLGSHEATRECDVLGLYFSFLEPGDPTSIDDFTRQLLDLYGRVNGEVAPGRSRPFEVVHVLFWSNAHDALDLEQSFRSHMAELPWLAVPNDDYERKVSRAFITCLPGPDP
jgi:hypothetical protein